MCCLNTQILILRGVASKKKTDEIITFKQNNVIAKDDMFSLLRNLINRLNYILEYNAHDSKNNLFQKMRTLNRNSKDEQGEISLPSLALAMINSGYQKQTSTVTKKIVG